MIAKVNSSFPILWRTQGACWGIFGDYVGNVLIVSRYVFAVRGWEVGEEGGNIGGGSYGCVIKYGIQNR